MSRLLSLLLLPAALIAGLVTSEIVSSPRVLDLLEARVTERSVRAHIMQRETALTWMPAGTLEDRDMGAWRFSSGVPFDPVLKETGRGICDMDFHPDGLLMHMGLILWGRHGCPLLIQRHRLGEAYGPDTGDALFEALLDDMEA